MGLNRGSGIIVAAIVTALVVAAAPAHARPAPDYEMPFPCAEDWYGSTRSSHSPSVHSIDWNGTDDLGRRVVAAAAGVVTRVENLGSRSYGLYAIIDHGGGEDTLYAHLQKEYLTLGQRVDRGQVIGRVGESGNVTGPHLHFEERKNGRNVAPWFHDRAFVQGTSQRSRNCNDIPVAGDWSGDGKADLGVFRRKANARFVLDVAGVVRKTTLFLGTDTPLVGHWDGGVTPQLGRHRSTTGTFELRTTNGSLRSVAFGKRSDIGIAGDWDGDGATEVGVWRPGKAKFLMRRADGTKKVVALGTTDSLPATGDWNGDGRTDLAAFDSGTWRLWSVDRKGVSWSASLRLGAAEDLPVTGDWNGDGATDLGVWTPSSATFTLRRAQPQSLKPGRLVTREFGKAR